MPPAPMIPMVMTYPSILVGAILPLHQKISGLKIETKNRDV